MSAIRQWLEEIGLSQYAEAFQSNDLGMQLLPQVDDQVLKDIGIASAGHRMRIRAAIQKLASRTEAASAKPQPVPPIRVTSPPAPTEGERRQATVLFSDLSGYTAMNERLDPETVTEVVGRIKAEAVKIVEAHGGIVNQFVGDEIMALFGIPVAHEDDPLRAVRAAFALHRMVKEMAATVETRIGQPLRLHTGIDCGLVVTNLRDQRDGTVGVTGDTVNTGARLAALANTDEVLASPQMHHRIADYFETEALPAMTLKGKADPMVPYRILRPTRAETRFDAAMRRGLTGYTGRAAELANLLGCLKRALSGEGQVVAVIGEAGTGKSRFLFELRNSIGRDEVDVVEGRCQSYGSETPYLPFLDALRRALDLREDDRPEDLHNKAEAKVISIDPELERFLPHYLHLLSIASDQYALSAQLQGAERKRAFEQALTAIFTLSARKRPLVVVLEDWHWVDATSDAVLKNLAGLVDQYPLMIVLLCRPEYDLKWAAPAHLTQIFLKPLAPSETAALACAALKIESLPEDLKALIHERTGGNPLFIEEVCHTLVEERILTVNDRRAQLTQNLDTVRLPDTVQAVIRARVDRLDNQGKEVLRLASVIGREFARTLLERVAGAGDSLTTTLEALKAQDLIRQVRVLPEPKYIFKHVLTQVVVYETLLFVRRQALHELIAQATEELYAGRIEEHYESLAYHYQHSDNREKAIHYLHLAGNKAKARYVLQQTVKNYQHAITLLESLDKSTDRMRMHIDIAVKWADLVVPSSELIEALKRAQLYAEQLDDNDRLAKATSFLGQMLFYVGNTDAAIPELTRVIEMSGLLTDQDRVGSAYRVLGHLYTNHGNRAEGLRNLKLALPIVRATGNCFEEACSIGLIARERGFSGEFTQSFQTFNEAVRVAQAGRERSVEAWIVGMWKGFVYCTKGDWHAAAATCDEAMAICRDIENLWAAALAMVTKGYAISMMETSKTHIALLEQGVAQHKQTGVPVLSMDVLSTFAEILCLNAQYDEALEQADGALERSRDGFYAPAKPRAHRVRAMAMARRGGYDWSVIEAAMDSSLASATEADIPSERGVGHFRYAEILHEKGDRARAREHLSKAEELFCELEMSWWMDKAANLRRMIQ